MYITHNSGVILGPHTMGSSTFDGIAPPSLIAHTAKSLMIGEGGICTGWGFLPGLNLMCSLWQAALYTFGTNTWRDISGVGYQDTIDSSMSNFPTNCFFSPPHFSYPSNVFPQ